jgi:eukaryotic-like serine/threonine-protein kinase
VTAALPEHPDAPLIGDRYALAETIGQGRSTIRRAEDRRLRRQVAVKEVRLAEGQEGVDRARTRARREAYAAARLNNPGVVTVFDVVEEGGSIWLVMELVDAPSLAQVVTDQGPLNHGRAARIGLGVLGALQAAHAVGVVHRDVKPANVLVGRDDRTKLADFGVATIRDESRVTSTGTIVGSPSYMAPEQAMAADVGPYTDMWALGATLYFAVEGSPPFAGDSPLATASAVVHGEPRRMRSRGALAGLIRRLLHKDPQRRPDVRQVRVTLAAAATSGQRDTTLVSPAPAPPRPGGRGRRGTRDTRQIVVPAPPSTDSLALPEPPAPAPAPPSTSSLALPDPPDPTADRPDPAGPPSPNRAGQRMDPAGTDRPPPTREVATTATASASPAEAVETAAPEAAPPATGDGPGADEPADSAAAVSGEHAAVEDEAAGPANAGTGAGAQTPGGTGEADSGHADASGDHPEARAIRGSALAGLGPSRSDTVRRWAAQATPTRVAVGALVLVLVALTVWAAGRGDGASGEGRQPEDQGSSAEEAGRADGGSSPGTGRAASGDAETTTTTAENTAGRALAGWASYEDSAAGYSIAYPQGWQVEPPDGTRVDISDPQSGSYLRIDWTDEPRPDPVADWRHQSHGFAARHEGYQEVGIEPYDYRDYDAAVWEFRYRDGGADLHAVNLGFVTGDRGYALFFQTHEENWSDSQDTFATFQDTFRPS